MDPYHVNLISCAAPSINNKQIEIQKQRYRNSLARRGPGPEIVMSIKNDKQNDGDDDDDNDDDDNDDDGIQGYGRVNMNICTACARLLFCLEAVEPMGNKRKL